MLDVAGWIEYETRVTLHKSNDGGDIYMWNVEMHR